MTEQAIGIIDAALWYALLVFLLSFLIGMAYAALRVRIRLRKRAALRPEEGEELRLHARSEDVGAVFKSMGVSAAIAAVFFLLAVFSPYSFMENFVNSESWRMQPLRLTHLTQQRLAKGFSLMGEVYNQTEEPMEDITAVVKVYAVDEQILEEIKAEVEPSPLAAGQAGEFQVRYEKEPANLYGYEVVFRSPDGGAIPHMRGFDVRKSQLEDKQKKEPPAQESTPPEGETS